MRASGHRRRRVHRLEPRRRSRRARRRGRRDRRPLVRQARVRQPGGDARRARHPRRDRPRRRSTSSSTSPRRPTCRPPFASRRATRRSNVVGTVRVAEAALKAGARIVFTSTGGAIYGECDGPATEDSPRRPLSPYGIAKLCAEEYLQRLQPHPRLEPRRRAARERVRAAAVGEPRGRRRLDLPRSARPRRQDGDLRRRAPDPRLHLRRRRRLGAARRVPRTRAAASSTSGAGSRLTVLALYEACAEAAGVAAEPAFEPARLGDLRRSALDVSLAAAELGFRAADAACRRDRPHVGLGDRESQTREESARHRRNRRPRGCTASHAARADPPLARRDRRRERSRGARARAPARPRRDARREAALARDRAPGGRDRLAAGRDARLRRSSSGGDPPHERAGRQGAAARPRAGSWSSTGTAGRARPGRRRAGSSTSATRSRAPRTPATRTTRRASSCTARASAPRACGSRKDLGVKVVGPLDGIARSALARRPARRDRRRLSAPLSTRLAGVHARERLLSSLRCRRGSGRRAPSRG